MPTLDDIEITDDQLLKLLDRVADMLSSTWMTSDQVCDWLQIRRDYLYHLVAEDRIPHVKIGRLLRFKRAELVQWVETFRTKPAPSTDEPVPTPEP